jgi:ribosome hibernation promoting factor
MEERVKIDIRTRGFAVTPGLRAHIERRLDFALDRSQERIARVWVTVADVNGPRGGDDKSCRVDVRLQGGRTVRAAVRDGDAYAAIGAAAHRIGRIVARTLGRERVAPIDVRLGAPRPHAGTSGYSGSSATSTR